MHAKMVDPRDQTWEIARPNFRVYFWTGTAAEEWELSEGDVHDVIQWAEARRGGRTYTLYVCANVDGLGLVRLAGEDPTEGEAELSVPDLS